MIPRLALRVSSHNLAFAFDISSCLSCPFVLVDPSNITREAFVGDTVIAGLLKCDIRNLHAR